MEWLPLTSHATSAIIQPADDAAPKYVARRHAGSLHPQVRHRSHKFRAKRAGPHRKQREKKLPEHCWEERWPISEEFSSHDAVQRASARQDKAYFP